MKIFPSVGEIHWVSKRDIVKPPSAYKSVLPSHPFLYGKYNEEKIYEDKLQIM
jgi:hypothetical protein